MHFHRDLLAIADTFGKHVVQGRRDDVFTGTPPLGFTFGLGGLLIFPMRIGASTCYWRRRRRSNWSTGSSASALPPSSPRPPPIARSSGPDAKARCAVVRRAVSAGEHLAKPVWEEMHAKTGIKLIDGIGSTEMLHVFVSAADDDIRPGATGRAVPGYRAAVLDDEGNPAADGLPGRLAVVGPTGCRYLADSRQASYVQHGWNITGDTYVRDADGYFWYQARSDDMIVSSGYNIGGAGGGACVGAAPGRRRVRGDRPTRRRARRDRARRRRAARRGERPTRRRWPSCRPSSSRSSPRTSTRGRSSSSMRCRGHRPARCSGSGCVSARPRGSARGQRRARKRRKLMRIAVIGGGPGGLYFAALARALDKDAEITVWERNAPEDTFGFGVVFSDETLGGIEHADPVIYRGWRSSFARWDDIDVHYRGT